MSPLLIAQLLFAGTYAGFQWTVQVVVYRQFPLVPPSAFALYERSHQRRISYVVGPLFAGLGVTTAGLLVVRPVGVPWWGSIAAAVLLAIILAATAFRAVPLHGRLAAGWDESAYRSLLRVDLLRALAGTANAALAVVLLLR